MRSIQLSENQYALRFLSDTDDFYYNRPAAALAVDALTHIADAGCCAPLVICGPSGCGKTHLLRGFLADHSLEQPRKKALMLTAREFVSGLIAAAAGGAPDAFSDRYSSADLLVLDDMDFVIGKAVTQAALAHAVKKIVSNGGQAILLLTAPPAAFRPLMESIKNDLPLALTADMSHPGAECRRSYALARRARVSAAVPDAALEAFAEKLPSIGAVRAALTAYAASDGEKAAEEIIRLYTQPRCGEAEEA